MSIWILALVLCAVFGVIGFFSGAIRTSMMWVGVFLAGLLTKPIAPKLQGLMPKIGVKHPLWIEWTPYIIVFSLITLVVFGIGFAIHHKVALIYKYKYDDFTRIKWERLNRGLGLCVGLVIAVMLFFTVAKVIYVGGYVTAQLESEESNNPFWIKFLSQGRRDMAATGLDRSVAALDKTPKSVYDAADVVGLIYHNPALQSRLANYPDFLAIGQRPEFQEVSKDQDYNNLIFGKANFGDIINHPNTQRFIANQDVINAFKSVDVKDLDQYLRTGKSPKYDDMKILGRWILDKDAVLTAARKARPDMKAAELKAVKAAVERMPDLTLINLLDKKAIIRTEGGGDEAAPADGQPAAAQPPVDPTMPERYREAMARNRPQAQPGAQAQRPAAPAVAAPPVIRLGAEGEWEEAAAGRYVLRVPDPAGKAQTLAALIRDDELIVTKDQMALVFYKAE